MLQIPVLFVQNTLFLSVKMPLPPPAILPISNRDVVSFTLDDPTYDVDRPVLIDPNDPSRYFSHRTATALVRRLIGGLKAAGLRHGDTVCIHSFNSLVFPMLALAIIGAGGRCTGTNPGYTKHELNHTMRTAKVRFILAEPDVLANVLPSMKENGLDPKVALWILNTQPNQLVPQNLRSWKALLEHDEQDWIRFDDEESSNQICQLFNTSGTTGLPKCSMTSHRNLVAQHQLFFEPHKRTFPHKMVMCMPFFHAGILPQVLISTLKDGREAYVMRRFEVEPFLRYHTKYNLTEIFIVPPMIVSILASELADRNSDQYKPECSLRSIRNGMTGAAPCSADIQRRFSSLLGEEATFTQVWGMTETSGFAAMVPADIARRTAKGEIDTWGSVGRHLPNLYIKLIDEEGNDVTHTRKGELCVKGPTIIKGYFENSKATSESWDSDGFYKTGDVIRLDEHDLMYVEERVKELIKVRGFQVAPAELEGELTTHPKIIDAAVIGVTEKDGAELPRAYIVVRPGCELEKDEVNAYMKERLARYKQLEGGIRFVDSIPKLPSGKILKRVLREEAKKEMSQPQAKL